MKKKFSVLLLCIMLLLTFSLNATATISPNDQQTTNSIVDEKINLDEYVNTNSSRSQTPGIVSGGIYRIKNVGSGKYMNVHYGVDGKPVLFSDSNSGKEKIIGDDRLNVVVKES